MVQQKLPKSSSNWPRFAEQKQTIIFCDETIARLENTPAKLRRCRFGRRSKQLSKDSALPLAGGLTLARATLLYGLVHSCAAKVPQERSVEPDQRGTAWPGCSLDDASARCAIGRKHLAKAMRFNASTGLLVDVVESWPVGKGAPIRSELCSIAHRRVCRASLV